jgi:lysophospholipase L1-like esterase
MRDGAPRRRSRRVLGSLVGAATLLVSLLGVELALRAGGYDPRAAILSGRTRLVRPSADPRRGYELVPGARGSGWGTEVAVNSVGFRGPEPRSGDGDATRIVCLGDSITFGNDLSFEETWPQVLERRLLEAGVVCETFNLALGGYDTVQEVATLEALGLGLAPRHVVLAFCVNDLGIVSMSMETPFDEEDTGPFPYGSRIAQWLKVQHFERVERRALTDRNREALYVGAHAQEIRALPEDESLRRGLAALLERVSAGPDPSRQLASRRIPARWFASEGRLGRLEFAFQRLETLARGHGFTVTVLLVPYLAEDADIDAGTALVGRLAVLHGFRFVDPTLAFRARGLEALRMRPLDPVHPDAVGHELLARALAPEFTRAD